MWAGQAHLTSDTPSHLQEIVHDRQGLLARSRKNEAYEPMIERESGGVVEQAVALFGCLTSWISRTAEDRRVSLTSAYFMGTRRRSLGIGLCCFDGKVLSQ